MQPLFWLTMAVAAFVLEGLTTALISIWFGVGALVAMLLAALGVGTAAQWLTFSLVSILAFACALPYLRRRGRKKPVPTNDDRLPGMQGVMLADGRVRVDGVDWNAALPAGVTLPEGAAVRVLATEGTTLKVEPLPEKTTV